MNVFMMSGNSRWALTRDNCPTCSAFSEGELGQRWLAVSICPLS